MRWLVLFLGFFLGLVAAFAYAIFWPRYPPAAVPPLPEDPAITVILGEPFLDEMIRRAARGSSDAIAPTNVRSELRDDTLVVRADVRVLGSRATGTAVLRPVLRDGRLRIEVVNTTVGAMPVPLIAQVVERELNARIGALLAGMPVTFTGVDIDEARGMTVTCRVDLDRLGARDAVDAAREQAGSTLPSH